MSIAPRKGVIFTKGISGALLFSLLRLTAASLVYSRNFQTTIEDYLQAYIKLDRFSGTILVARGGQILLDKGYGWANAELQVKNTPEMKFRVGSVTKQFTAMAVVQLEEKGLLSMDDRIDKYIPGYPNGDRITIRHLLTHTSGIPSYTASPEIERDKRLPATPLQIIDRFKDEPLQFEPGTEFRYSDSGYVLLGYIVEKVSGLPYGEYLEKNIFGPLGMSDTGYDDAKKVLKNRASGYISRNGRLSNADFNDMGLPYAAGGLYSTAHDLYKWDRSLYGNGLVSDRSKREIFTPYKNGYGFGWYIDDLYSHRKIWHYGIIDGFCAMIMRLVDDDICVVVLSNLSNVPIIRMGEDIASILLEKPHRTPGSLKTMDLDRGSIKGYVGHYEPNPGPGMEVEEINGRLFLQLPGQWAIMMFPRTRDEFFTIDFGIESEISFQRDAAGRINGLTFRQNNNERKAEKVPQYMSKLRAKT